MFLICDPNGMILEVISQDSRASLPRLPGILINTVAAEEDNGDHQHDQFHDAGPQHLDRALERF